MISCVYSRGGGGGLVFLAMAIEVVCVMPSFNKRLSAFYSCWVQGQCDAANANTCHKNNACNYRLLRGQFRSSNVIYTNNTLKLMMFICMSRDSLPLKMFNVRLKMLICDIK